MKLAFLIPAGIVWLWLATPTYDQRHATGLAVIAVGLLAIVIGFFGVGREICRRCAS